jgi:hypothetical protein
VKYTVLSGGSKPPSLFTQPLPAIQALEARLRSDGRSIGETKGNAPIREVLEGTRSSLVWGDYRIDIVEVA